MVPLRAMYRVGGEEDQSINLYDNDNLKAAVDKFNYLEGAELDGKS